MTVLAAVVAGISGADLLGLVVAVALVAYLLYALLRGERM
jgi:K+-transporting ATPase KdpF subunit